MITDFCVSTYYPDGYYHSGPIAEIHAGTVGDRDDYLRVNLGNMPGSPRLHIERRKHGWDIGIFPAGEDKDEAGFLYILDNGEVMAKRASGGGNMELLLMCDNKPPKGLD